MTQEYVTDFEKDLKGIPIYQSLIEIQLSNPDIIITNVDAYDMLDKRLGWMVGG